MNLNPNKLFGLILVGGKSKRMGKDKSSIAYHGRPQLEHSLEILNPFCEQVFLSGRKDQSSMNGNWIIDKPDYADKGPLSGILSAMEEFPQKSWIILGIDLPFVTNKTLEYLIKNRNPLKIATAFKSAHDDLPEPLCAIWEAHAFSKIKESFNQGIYCPRKILINSDAYLLLLKDNRWLDNVNTPEEYEEALKVIKHESQ